MKVWVLILIRSIGLFFLVLIMTKIMGKSNPSKMTHFKFVNYVVVAILAALISTNIISSLAVGLLALAVWCVIPIALDYMGMKSKVMYDLFNGKDVILVKDGKVMEENLKQVRYTGEDLLRELRVKNAFNLADVEFAIMEPTGDVNVVLKSDKKPITPHDMGWQVAPSKPTQTVILDGTIIYESLSNLGLNEGWLMVKLKGLGVSLNNIFIGQVDSNGDLYVDLFDDIIQVPKPQVKELLYANIEKCNADLSSFALETENEEAKSMYLEHADRLHKLLIKLEPLLLR
jgi:uncharacterized membrane protein YcaP (DUF421 family)